jgi:hypothetical protein
MKGFTTMASTTKTTSYGGEGGKPFGSLGVQKLGLRTSKEVDALVLNGTTYGRTVGSPTDQVFLTEDYISSVEIRTGSRVDYLSFTTSKGDVIAGGGNGGNSQKTLSNIRVVALGGRSGNSLDQIQITYVTEYMPSTLVAKNQQFIIGFTAPGTNLTEYASTSSRTVDSYQQITTTMIGQSYNASVEAEYYAKVSASVNITYENTSVQTIEKQLETVLQGETGKYVKIDDGKVGVLLLNGTIKKGSDDNYWMFPTTEVTYAVIPVTQIDSVVNHYDLTGELSTQMPLLIPLRTEKNGYTYYTAPEVG